MQINTTYLIKKLFCLIVFAVLMSCDPCETMVCQQGQCIDGTCICDDYYEGELCSLTYSKKFARYWPGEIIFEGLPSSRGLGIRDVDKNKLILEYQDYDLDAFITLKATISMATPNAFVSEVLEFAPGQNVSARGSVNKFESSDGLPLITLDIQFTEVINGLTKVENFVCTLNQ